MLNDKANDHSVVPTAYIDFRHNNRQLLTVMETGEVTFADDLTLDEAKYVIREIVKWKKAVA